MYDGPCCWIRDDVGKSSRKHTLLCRIQVCLVGGRNDGKIARVLDVNAGATPARTRLSFTDPSFGCRKFQDKAKRYSVQVFATHFFVNHEQVEEILPTKHENNHQKKSENHECFVYRISELIADLREPDVQIRYDAKKAYFPA